MESARFEKVIGPQSDIVGLGVGEILAYRDMLYFLVLRDLKIRFKQSLLGAGWALLQPVVMVAVFTLVCQRGMNVSFSGPYELFFLAGLLPWSYFSKAFAGGVTCIVNEVDLVKKIYFPRLVLPLAQIISALSDFAIALLVMGALMAWRGVAPGPNLLLLPVFLLLAALFALALSLWLAPLNVRFRDVQIVLPFLLQVLFMLSPVMYPMEAVQGRLPPALRWAYGLNPVAAIIEGFRFSILGAGQPFAAPCLCSYAAVVLLAMGGLAFFNHTQRKFADVI